MAKSDWETYAANIAGRWDLCANCESGDTAKKLYRQYNFYRALLSLPSVGAPLDNTEVAIELYPSIQYQKSGSGGPDSVWTITPDTGVEQLWLGQLGKGLTNPLVGWSDAVNNVQLFSGPMFDWVVTMCNALGSHNPFPIPNTEQAYICFFNASGAPGPRAFTNFLYTWEA